MLCGYARLLEKFNLKALSLVISARENSGVNRMVRASDRLLVPARMAPAENDVVGHLEFAVKHEGVNLEILSQVLSKVGGEELQSRLDLKPNGAVLRKLAWLWEEFSGKRLDDSRVGGNYVELFDSKLYFTGAQRRIARWRILYNGLGPLAYCPTVRKTELLTEARIASIFTALREQLSGVEPLLLQRAADWAYLSETRSSFEIEKEKPSGTKMQRFVALLKSAATIGCLNEDALSNIQNMVVSDVYAQEVAYRSEQNWLALSGRGGFGRVTYVPPPPENLDELMQGLLEIANADEHSINPLVAAAVCSFGFVYLHPFLDGNGRISRFLIHRQLNRGNVMPPNCILPVSAVMLKYEFEYLQALETFSTACRELWDVVHIGPGDCDFTFHGSLANYRYWDATVQCEFLYRMLHEAVASYMAEELSFLGRYDRIYRRLNEQFDVVQKDLDLLVASGVASGRISQNLRKKYQYRVPEAFFPALEALLIEELSSRKS